MPQKQSGKKTPKASKDDPPLKNFSLSRYFPKSTEYFYGYPAEEDSHFFNGVPPEIEELVAARPLICAGPNVKVFCFRNTLSEPGWSILRNELKTVSIKENQIITFPKSINPRIYGPERNKKLKQALARRATPGKLVMAQPYLSPRLKTHYQIPSNRIIWLNDKKNLSSYIPAKYLPKIYDEFLDGKCFKEAQYKIPLPCVIKVSSSSSGDGVRICKTEKDLRRAKRNFAKLEGIILATEFIEAKRNLGVQFGIPADPEKPIEVINWHEQLVNKKGQFMGGIIENCQNKFKNLEKILLTKILPEIRKKGWYGIGGFDILITQNSRFCFIDPNFRMTGMTVYDCLTRNKVIKKSCLVFTGMFRGTAKEFRKKIVPIAKKDDLNQILYITTLIKHGKIFRFNAALLFENRKEIPKLIKKVLSKGVISSILQKHTVKSF